MTFCHSKFFLLALICVLTGLSACTSVPPENIESAPTELHPMSQIEGELPPYKIQINDILELKLLLNPELEEEVTVRPDGKISTAVAQNVTAYGRTPEALQDELNDLYAEHLSDPSVAVIVKSFAPSRFYVLGEVNEPGEYISVGSNLTMLQALSMAGNVKNSADTDAIIIIRRSPVEPPKAYLANYDDATKGLSPYSDIQLSANDVLFVPRTDVADTYVLYEQYLQQFIRPSLNFGLSYQLNDNGNN